jgi:hypothetical protein
MAGEERLAAAVRSLAPTLEQQELDERERVALERARRYADDPAAAQRDLDRWGRGGSDDAEPA